jgi:hypothetical protein
MHFKNSFKRAQPNDETLFGTAQLLVCNTQGRKGGAEQKILVILLRSVLQQANIILLHLNRPSYHFTECLSPLQLTDSAVINVLVT